MFPTWGIPTHLFTIRKIPARAIIKELRKTLTLKSFTAFTILSLEKKSRGFMEFLQLKLREEQLWDPWTSTDKGIVTGVNAVQPTPS